jgi:hypothetical protein
MEGPNGFRKDQYIPSPDIKSFKTNQEMGSHFGNQAQAHDSGFIGEESRDEGQIYPVHLSIKNPIRLRDYGSFEGYKVATQLRNMGHSIKKEISNKEVQDYLKSLGYDGIVYLNRREGLKNWKSGLQSPKSLSEHSDEAFKKVYPEAEDSYIAFDPHQIKSAIGNNGNFDPNSPNINEARGGYVRRAYKKGGRVEGGVWHEKDAPEPFMPHQIPGVHIVTADAGEPIFSGRK